MKNMKEFCRKCKYAEEPSDKDPCKSCMDFGIAALGRPANFRETDPEMRKIGDRIEEVYQNLIYCSEQSASRQRKKSGSGFIKRGCSERRLLYGMFIRFGSAMYTSTKRRARV